MQNWRWDQGRLEYFAFDNIKSMARTLVNLEGASLRPGDPDALRQPLQTQTGLPFSPNHYKVWRNYGRVFECCLLATDRDGVLAVTDVCRRPAEANAEPIDVDEYLSFLIPRFYYPFPAFQDYNVTDVQSFPFCATLKYLLATLPEPREASISLEDVFSLIIGNDCTGVEPLDHYLHLRHTGHAPVGDQRRQVREMLIFSSQLSFLKWRNNRLFLDILPGDTESSHAMEEMLTPIIRPRNPNQALEVLSLGGTSEHALDVAPNTTRRQPADVFFTEGKRVRVTHLRTERSPRLRELFFSGIRHPYLCNMCSTNAQRIYPWTDNILEVHHLLPLSSAITITTRGTSLADIVALCPNCHKSVHTYYKNWLNTHTLADFRSKAEAASVYQEAKGRIRL